jgi:hypothetical protein
MIHGVCQRDSLLIIPNAFGLVWRSMIRFIMGVLEREKEKGEDGGDLEN